MVEKLTKAERDMLERIVKGKWIGTMPRTWRATCHRLRDRGLLVFTWGVPNGYDHSATDAGRAALDRLTTAC